MEVNWSSSLFVMVKHPPQPASEGKDTDEGKSGHVERGQQKAAAGADLPERVL